MVRNKALGVICSLAAVLSLIGSGLNGWDVNRLGLMFAFACLAVLFLERPAE